MSGAPAKARGRLQGRCAAALVAVVLAAATPVAADSGLFAEGARLLEAGDAEAAHRLFHGAALLGDPAGQFALGVLYHEGRGVAAEPATATHWFRLAAEQGYAPAQFNLGNAYLAGRGVEVDNAKAAFWWDQAAHQDHPQAQFNLGSLYLQGGAQAPPEQIELGIAWIRRAAEHGARVAERTLTELGEAPDYAQTRWQPEREPLRGEARLLSLPAGETTLQLASMRRLESALEFVDAHRLAGRAMLFRFRQQDRVWIGVAYGRYANEPEALATIAEMSPTFRAFEPYPRSLAAIQARIAAIQPAESTTPAPTE